MYVDGIALRRTVFGLPDGSEDAVVCCSAVPQMLRTSMRAESPAHRAEQSSFGTPKDRCSIFSSHATMLLYLRPGRW